MTEIDPDRFFTGFLALDPAYEAIAPALKKLCRQLQLLLDRESLTLSEFVDVTSIEYDREGEIIPKDIELLRALAKAISRVDLTRELLRGAAFSTLTMEQITEGPTSVKIPTEVFRSQQGFQNLLKSLHPAYRDCKDCGSLIRQVMTLKIHRKVVFVLFSLKRKITAYFYPAPDMLAIQRRLVIKSDDDLVRIYNAKMSLDAFCAATTWESSDHVKVIYLGGSIPSRYRFSVFNTRG